MGQCSAFLLQRSYCPFYGLFGATFFSCLGFLLVISVFKTAPEGSADVLSSVPKWKKTVRSPREEIHVLDKFHSGMSYSAVDCELNVDGSTIYTK